MYTIILSMIIVAIITAIIVQFIEDLDGEIVIKIFRIFIFGFGLGGIIGILIALLGYPQTKVIEIHKEIISLKDNSSTKGDFFLSCGTIDGSMVYSMYVKGKDGIILKQINCKNAVIQFIPNGSKSELIERNEVATNTDWFFFENHTICNIIKIPKNSIKQEILLDAE